MFSAFTLYRLNPNLWDRRLELSWPIGIELGRTNNKTNPKPNPYKTLTLTLTLWVCGYRHVYLTFLNCKYIVTVMLTGVLDP